MLKHKDMSSPHARGFNPGDDDKLQAAIKKNLKIAHAKHLSSGKHENAARVKKHLEALEEHERLEKIHDPNDQDPDDPHPGKLENL